MPDTAPTGDYAPAGRPDGKSWTYTPPVTFDQPLDIDLTPDTLVIAGHGAGVQENLAHLPTVAEPTAPPAANPLHPLALPSLHPQQVIMLGRPTLHRQVSTLLADPSVPVFALTTGPRWPDVSGNSQATGTRGRHRGHARSALAEPVRGGERQGRRGGPRPTRRPPVDDGPARRGRSRRGAAGRRPGGARRVQPGSRRGPGRPEPARREGALQPWRRGHRRHGVDGHRGGAGPRADGRREPAAIGYPAPSR